MLAMMFGQYQYEFITANARYGVRRAHCCKQLLGHAFQEVVAAHVAKQIVDEFEVVDVEEQDPNGMRISIGIGYRLA